MQKAETRPDAAHLAQAVLDQASLLRREGRALSADVQHDTAKLADQLG